MAFLDNSGDIILDAVLTDTGRFRLAKGDGSFKIVKFALGDEEINYGSYNKDHASGSAYYDLEILQTPILEAFTNNTSTMNTKLISIPRTNLLYLPVMKLGGGTGTQTSGSAYNGNFVVCVDKATAGDSSDGAIGVLNGTGSFDVTTGEERIRGFLNGYKPTQTGGSIYVNQGLDTTEIPSTYTLDADLVETQYIVQMDNRLGSIVSSNNNPAGGGAAATPANISFIDDDNIASYYFSTNDTLFVSNIPQGAANVTIQGPRGTGIAFDIQASTDLATSTYLFEQLGSTGYNVIGGFGSPTAMRFIDTIVKITGATTGYTINIPVRYIKKV